MAARTFLTEVEKQFAAIGERIGQSTLCSIKSDLVDLLNKAIDYEVLDGANLFCRVRVETPELRKGVVLRHKGESGPCSGCASTPSAESSAPVMFVLAIGIGMRRGDGLVLTEK